MLSSFKWTITRNVCRGYNTAVREAGTEAQEWDLYVDIKPKAHRKPNPLSIFNVGTENDGANTVTVELGKPIFEFSSSIWGAPTQKRGSDNPFLAMFLAVDVVFIFKIVLSALAILFAYNTISGEREDGTLKLVLSNAIPRDTVVLGKYLGGMSIAVPDCFGEFNRGTANRCLFSGYRL